MTSELVMLVVIGDSNVSPQALTTREDIPDPIRGEAFNGAIIPQGGEEPYLYSLIDGSLPPGLSLDTSTGEITGTPTTQGYFEYTIEVTDNLGDAVQTTIGTNTKGGILLGPADLPVAEDDIAYSTLITSTGGVGPYTYSLVEGSLPAGFGLTTNGANAGLLEAATPFAPTVALRSTFTIRSTDTNGNFGDQVFTMIVFPHISLITTSLQNGLKGLPYSSQLQYAHGLVNLYPRRRPTVTWEVTNGTLPPGLLLSPTTGVVSGVPLTEGLYSFDLVVTDSLGATASNAQLLRIHYVDEIDSIFTDSFGNGIDNVFTIEHNLFLQDVPKLVIVYGDSQQQPIEVDWVVIDNNTIEITTAKIPGVGEYFVKICG
jgi:large repetitive protein